ncbi:MAG: hypothetical protein U0575_10505 [Phycisphaerales bacterium]
MSRRTCAAVSTISSAFCFSIAETEPYDATIFASSSASGLAAALRSGRTRVTIWSDVTVSGSLPV